MEVRELQGLAVDDLQGGREDLDEAGPVCPSGWAETVKLVTATRSDPGQASWRSRYEEIETVL